MSATVHLRSGNDLSPKSDNFYGMKFEEYAKNACVRKYFMIEAILYENLHHGKERTIMEETSKGISITLAVLLGIFLQVLFAFADTKDTPDKAVIEFAQAYFGFDESMTDRLCEASAVVDEISVTEQYIQDAKEKAGSLGYSLWYMKEKLYHVDTHTISMEEYKSAKVRLTAERKPPLRSFFTRRSSHVDQVLDVVYDEKSKKWKVCGDFFSLSEG